MGVNLRKVLALALVLMLPFSPHASAEPSGAVAEQGTSIVISEIQVADEEFIELHNGGDTSVLLDGWRLEHKSASMAASWTTKTPTQLTGELTAHSYFIVASASYPSEKNAALTTTLSNTGGHTRLVRPGQTGAGDQVVDLVGWGTAEESEASAAVAPKAGASIQRCFANNVLGDTNNNAEDLKEFETKTPGSAIACPAPPVDETPPPSGDASCSGIIVSEILPNAIGSDTGQEFIELYNSTTDFIDLAGCGLQLAGDEHIYRFESQILNPEQYVAFYDNQTGITLPNSAGGAIYLLSATDEELQSVSYPGDLAEAVAWSWFGGVDWQMTYAPSPNGVNVTQPTEPCPAGQVRNEESGRCVNDTIESTGLKPCDPSQERNPETNRCRNVAATATAALTPCKSGQERNPETNRCRAVASAASQLKPCSPGQERNPETNRCRKVAGTTSGSDNGVKDIETPTSSSVNWWLAGIAGTGAIGYGLWEWRRDIAGFVSRLGRKTTSTAQ